MPPKSIHKPLFSKMWFILFSMPVYTSSELTVLKTLFGHNRNLKLGDYSLLGLIVNFLANLFLKFDVIHQQMLYITDYITD